MCINKQTNKQTLFYKTLQKKYGVDMHPSPQLICFDPVDKLRSDMCTYKHARV